jgi:hypothetical protein
MIAFRAREALIIGTLIAAGLILLALLFSSTHSDVTALRALSPFDRAAFARSECVTLRAVCGSGRPDVLPSCAERAKTLLALSETDDSCRALAQSIAAPTR